MADEKGGKLGGPRHRGRQANANEVGRQRAESRKVEREKIAALVAEILDTPIERVRTYITQFPPEGWGIGGVPADVSRADEVAARREAAAQRAGT